MAEIEKDAGAAVASNTNVIDFRDHINTLAAWLPVDSERVDSRAAELAAGWPEYLDDEPGLRLDRWYDHARQNIGYETCRRLARHGFADLAMELLRQRGDV